MRAPGIIAAGGLLLLLPACPAPAQSVGEDVAALRAELATERAALERQQIELNEHRRRLQAIEDGLIARNGGGAAGANTRVEVVRASGPTTVPLPPLPPAQSASAQSGSDVQPVGQAPTDQRQVQVAVLSDQGGIITSRGQLTVEPSVEYAHADRNRTIFRGIEIPASVLIGVFDINESRQDVLTGGGTLRLGLSSRLEINGRAPFVYRSDKSVLAPVSNPSSPNAGQMNHAVRDAALGDVEFGARYQLTNARGGLPYLIVGIQAVAPTGTNPFTVSRDSLGNALEAATGAGFWGVSPQLTAILPSDPAVLFGTLGYTYNFGRNIDRAIGPSFIEYVKPGGEPSASLGIAISLNTRTSLSMGYAHTWSMGTKTKLRPIDAKTGALGDLIDTTTRDLQIGRFLFGMSYRANARTTVNWNLEVGATDDATDLRTTLRVPFTIGLF